MDQEQRTERATGMSSMDNDWQSPAKPATSIGGMVLQSPAKPAGSIGDQVVLAVGIWCVTLSWRGLPVVKSARGPVLAPWRGFDGRWVHV